MTAHVLRADAARLPLAEASVDLVVTSPPYNAGIGYEGVSDLRPMSSYLELCFRSAREIARVLKPGGRAWVNVAPAIPGGSEEGFALASVWHAVLSAAGLRFRDCVIWEQVGHDQATAWGSYLSPNAPNLRGRFEVILLFFKHTWRRGRVERNDLPASEWPELTRNVWRIPCAPRGDHPAPFPPELPRRAILLSTWPGDLVLDPFCGRGTSLRVARDLGRRADLSATYARDSWESVAQGVLI